MCMSVCIYTCVYKIYYKYYDICIHIYYMPCICMLNNIIILVYANIYKNAKWCKDLSELQIAL